MHVTDRLHEYLAEELDEASAQQVREHVASCPECAHELELTRRFSTLCQGLQEQPLPSGFMPRLRQRIEKPQRVNVVQLFSQPILRYAVAAMLACVIGFGAWSSQPYRVRSSELLLSAGDAGAVVQKGDAVELVDRPMYIKAGGTRIKTPPDVRVVLHAVGRSIRIAGSSDVEVQSYYELSLKTGRVWVEASNPAVVLSQRPFQVSISDGSAEVVVQDSQVQINVFAGAAVVRRFDSDEWNVLAGQSIVLNTADASVAQYSLDDAWLNSAWVLWNRKVRADQQKVASGRLSDPMMAAPLSPAWRTAEPPVEPPPVVETPIATPSPIVSNTPAPQPSRTPTARPTRVAPPASTPAPPPALPLPVPRATVTLAPPPAPPPADNPVPVTPPPPTDVPPRPLGSPEPPQPETFPPRPPMPGVEPPDRRPFDRRPELREPGSRRFPGGYIPARPGERPPARPNRQIR